MFLFTDDDYRIVSLQGDMYVVVRGKESSFCRFASISQHKARFSTSVFCGNGTIVKDRRGEAQHLHRTNRLDGTLIQYGDVYIVFDERVTDNVTAYIETVLENNEEFDPLFFRMYNVDFFVQPVLKAL